MRPLLLAILVILPAFAGCAESHQWAGIAEAWMYKDSALVEVQLHRGSPAGDATADTARAGMGNVVAIENATATLRLRDGRNATIELTDWTFDRENDTAAAPLNITRFDGFRLNATFVMKDGSRLATHELASWTEQYRRPYHATLRLSPLAGNTSLTLSLYEVEAGARELFFDSVVQNGTLTPVPVLRIASWSVDGRASGGEFHDTMEPTVGQTVRVVLPHADVTRAEPRYTLVLPQGVVITDRDVDNDVFPDTLVLQQRFRQEN